MSNRPNFPSDRTFILWGWALFIISALFFLIAGIRAGDWASIIGALFFLGANLLFLVPVLREKQGEEDK